MKKRLLVIFKLSISVGLIFFLYRNTPISDIKHLLSGINVWYLPFIGLLLFTNTIISALKWRLFLKSDGISLPLSGLTVSYMCGTFCNLFLPSNIGGDSYRVYDIARQSSDGVRSTASVFADRLSGFVALVILSLISSAYVAYSYKTIAFVVLPAALFVFFCLVLFFLLNQGPLRKLLQITGLEKIEAVNRISEKFLLSMNCYGSDKRMIVQVMVLSFVFQFSVITVVYLMARSLGTDTAFYYFSAFVPLITLMEALPISIYGVGVRDVGYVFFFTQAGMGEIETRTLALFFMIMAICYSLIGGIFFLYRMWIAPRKDTVESP